MEHSIVGWTENYWPIPESTNRVTCTCGKVFQAWNSAIVSSQAQAHVTEHVNREELIEILKDLTRTE